MGRLPSFVLYISSRVVILTSFKTKLCNDVKELPSCALRLLETLFGFYA